jgi:hypothetical protein
VYRPPEIGLFGPESVSAAAAASGFLGGRDCADGRIDFIFMQKHSSLQAVAARELFTNGDHYGRVSDHTGYCVEFEPNW